MEDIARLEEEELGYQPKPGSPSYKAEEEDELDAYMKVLSLRICWENIYYLGSHK